MTNRSTCAIVAAILGAGVLIAATIVLPAPSHPIGGRMMHAGPGIMCAAPKMRAETAEEHGRKAPETRRPHRLPYFLITIPLPLWKRGRACALPLGGYVSAWSDADSR